MLQIRLVTFDALHTIITPRYPIHVQYSQVFTPYLGVLPPESIKQSFKLALKAVQKEHPSYNKGAENWWRDVIRRTAIGAGGNEQALDANLTDIVGRLMKHFSSREGYKAFADAIPTIRHLRDKLGVRTAVVSNGDSRIRAVLKDLEFPDTVDPIVLSEEEGIEKPSREIFMKALELVNRKVDREQGLIHPKQCLHVGDELVCDYNGAVNSGLNALLLRRAGPEGEHEHKDMDENLEGIKVVRELSSIIPWVERKGM
ncbi:HAD-like domain-containing protein [Flammula alnicola]|nr:HAD-like domain-containing protein [Flammula alnicola]